MKVSKVHLRTTVNLPDYRTSNMLGLPTDDLTELPDGSVRLFDGREVFKFPSSMISYIQYAIENKTPEVTVEVNEDNRHRKPGTTKVIS